MSPIKRLSAVALAFVALAVGCTAETQSPVLTLLATPRGLPEAGGTTTIEVTATDAQGKAGSGTVTLTAATAGNFGGSTTATVTLANGTGKADYTCLKSADTLCTGRVRIDGTWTPQGGTPVSASFSVTIEAPDAGAGGGAGGGTGGGAGGGAGGGGGTVILPDGGTIGTPANVTFVGASPEKIGLQLSGDGGTGGVVPSQATSSVLTFKVADSDDDGIPGIALTGSVSGAGGARLASAATVTTGADGTAQFIVSSGTEIGTATVVVTGSGFVASGSVDIVAAIPSDANLTVECTKLVLGANSTATPPRSDVQSTCKVLLSDRYQNPVQIPTNVTWTSEAGNILSPSTSDETSGLATTTFNTFGKWPPVPTTPIAGEPVSTTGGRNPRDMVVTFIAAVRGEEQFYDGSGSSAGVKNGKADPGEWWVDLPEPFVDENDNGLHDPTEPFLDTARKNCATGAIEPKNGQWDPPNGCWDADTLIWRPSHLIYSGNASNIRFAPGAPITVSKTATTAVNMYISDSYYNRIDPDGLTVATTVNGPGTASVDQTGITYRSYGFDISAQLVEITETAQSPWTYTEVGPCDPTKVSPATAQTRCIHKYVFSNFGTTSDSGNYARLDLISTNATTANVQGSVNAGVTNSYSVSGAQYAPVTWSNQ